MQPQPQFATIFQVSQLTMQIKSLLESDFSYVEVEGEISGFTRHNSGHIYFNLKDEHAMLACTFFRHNYARSGSMQLQNGDKIIAKGNLSVYPPRGTYNLNITKCTYSGTGDLKAQYEALKKSLEARNYFSKKKPLPQFPKRIILVTSQTSAALQDMIKVASNRFCLCEFLLLDTLTQGKEAKHSIAKNLAYADRLQADIIVLARGGGSIEDLWSFNEMEVLEAIFACKTPVVSAIGHEIDYLLSDYVADVRAPTPSAAMEMILCDKITLFNTLLDLERLLKHKMQAFLTQKKEHIKHIQQNLKILSPHNRIRQMRQELQLISQRLTESTSWFYKQKHNVLLRQIELLELAKPTQKLVTIRADIDSMQKKLPMQYALFIQQKAQTIHQLKPLLHHAMIYTLTKKRAFLPTNLHMNAQDSMRAFLQQKRLMLENLHNVLEALNPSKKIQHGYAQILKDNAPILIANLKDNDVVEVIDSSGLRSAKILPQDNQEEKKNV